MADNFTSERAEAILAIVRGYPTGATLRDIARDLPSAPELRKLRGWVETMELGGLITLEGTGERTLVRLGARAAATAVSTAAPAPASPIPPLPPPHPVLPSAAVPFVPSVAAVPSAAADAAASNAQPAPTATPPAATADPGSEQMMLEAVQYVVAYGLVPEPATTHLQQLARKEGLGFPAAIAFVNRLLALLTTLSATDAVTLYGVTRAQYDEWLEHCALAGYPRHVAPAVGHAEAEPVAIAVAAGPPPATPAALPIHPRPVATPRPPPSPPGAPSVTAVRDRGPTASAPRPRKIYGVAESIAEAEGAAARRPILAPVRDQCPTAAMPSARPSNSTLNPTPVSAPAVSPRAPAGVPRSRTWSATGWAAALLSVGVGIYQFRNRLPTTSAPAATPVRQPPSAPPSSKTIPAPTPASPIENRDSNTEAAKRPTSAIENPYPAFPTSTGAYALTAGRWLPLPRNGDEVFTIDDGRPMPPQAIGMVIFGGSEPPPRLAATAGVIACVGAGGWTAAQIARQPALRDEQAFPPVELATLDTDASGARSTWWRELLPGVTGIGAGRIPATLEHPTANVTLLRPAVSLAPGRYALCCGKQYFEVAVE